MTVKIYERGTTIGERLHEVQLIKLEIDRLTSLLDEQKAHLLGHAIRNNFDSLKCGPVTLSRRERVSWVYSDAVKQAERRLKDRKQTEQDKGIAVSTVSEHPVVTFNAKIALSTQLIGA
jgi:hypothetical protein